MLPENPPRIASADDLNLDGCIALVEAIIKDAAQEYICARREYKKNPFDKDAKKHYEQSRRFFLSEYFFNLTDLDGKAVLEKLDAQAGGESNKSISLSG